MKIAIPVTNGVLDLHFGHCKTFAILDVDQQSKQISARNNVDSPPHEPGLLPSWLAEQGVNLVIAGGLGHKAKQLLAEKNIEVIVGAPAQAPETLVTAYLEESLVAGSNACDH